MSVHIPHTGAVRCYCAGTAWPWDVSRKYPGCGPIWVYRCGCGIEGPQGRTWEGAAAAFARMVAAIPAAWESENGAATVARAAA